MSQKIKESLKKAFYGKKGYREIQEAKREVLLSKKRVEYKKEVNEVMKLVHKAIMKGSETEGLKKDSEKLIDLTEASKIIAEEAFSKVIDEAFPNRTQKHSADNLSKRVNFYINHQEALDEGKLVSKDFPNEDMTKKDVEEMIGICNIKKGYKQTNEVYKEQGIETKEGVRKYDYAMVATGEIVGWVSDKNFRDFIGDYASDIKNIVGIQDNLLGKRKKDNELLVKNAIGKHER